MTAVLRLHSPSGTVSFPVDTATEPTYDFETLSEPPIEMVLDQREPVLVVRLLTRTTLLNPDRFEQLFFEYRPADPNRLFSEFYEVLQTNEAQDITANPEHSSVTADKDDLPEELVASELFREDWQFDDLRLPRLLAYTEFTVPPLDELERSVLTAITGDQQLRFGVRNLKEGLKAVSWLRKERVATPVMLTRETEYSWPADALILTIGSESNFEPLDQSTKTTFRDQLDSVRDEWRQKQLKKNHTLIERLSVEADNQFARYNDTDALCRYINYNDYVTLRTDSARKIREHYDTVRNDSYLDQSSKRDIITALTDRLETQRNKLIEQLRDSALEKFENEINRSFGTTVTADLQLYRWYNDIETILADPNTPAVGGDDSRVQEFQQSWQNWIANQHVDDDIKRVVREELQSTVERKKSTLESSLLVQVERACNNAADVVEKESDRRGKERERLYTLREMLDNPDVDLGSNPRREIRTIQEVFEFIDKHSYTTEFYNVARNTLSERIRECYTAEIKNGLGTYLGRLEDEPSRQADFLDAIQTVNSAGPVYNETTDHSAEEQQLMQLVAGAHEARYITGEQEDILRDEIEEYIQSCIGSLEADYEDRIDDILTTIYEDRQYKNQVDIFTEMLSLLDNPFPTNESMFPEVRKFRTVWRDVVENDIVSDEWQTEQKRALRAEFSRNKEDAEDFMTEYRLETGSLRHNMYKILFAFLLFAAVALAVFLIRIS